MTTQKHQFAAAIGAILLTLPIMAQAPEELKRQYLAELQHASEHVLTLAEAIPEDKYAWRPGEGVRSFSEVFLHVALGNFLLLDIAGVPVPEDLYSFSGSEAADRRQAMIERNQELEKKIRGKKRVLGLLKRSLDSVKQSYSAASEKDLARPVNFFGRDTRIRAVYLRILVHLNEHMGQAVAYARMNAIVPPWSKPPEAGK
ncbi:MAG: DinB family protein [bacterium]|nr:DinB family protein [bacterium]